MKEARAFSMCGVYLEFLYVQLLIVNSFKQNMIALST